MPPRHEDPPIWASFAARATLLALVLALLVPGGAMAASTASFSYPLSGTSNVDTGKPFAWSAVDGAQSYYLYVGTSRGAKDLVDSREITATSYAVPPLPTGQTLWGRIWTHQQDGRWTSQDVSFTAAAITTARFSNPVDGAQGVDTSKPFAWSAVDGAQSYYLYVGTSPGAKDLVDSHTIQATSYQVSQLPTGQTLYARIWTQLNGVWSYRDSAFTAAAPTRATFNYPQAGSTAVDTSKPFTWTSVPGADAYSLHIGTSQGAADLVNSGETQATSYDLSPLPTGRTLWARVWTKANGSWRYTDISFQVSISASRLTYPKQGQTDVNSSRQFKWSAVPEAEGYYLWIGSSPGQSDLFNSGSTSATEVNVPPLPVGQTLYARLYTKHNGTWNTYTTTTFTTAYSAATLTYPKVGAPNADVSKPFTWTGVAGASGYALWVGTSPGASDVVNSGQLSQSSYSTGPLPVGAQLWARTWTLSSGAWVYSADVPFSPAAQITAPAQQSTNVDRTQPITWAPGAVLNGRQPTYRLKLGTKPAADDLFDSGAITATSMTVPPSAMPTGKALYARVIVTLGDGTERRTDNVFTTSDTTTPPAEIDWGTDGPNNVDASKPFAWSYTDLAQAYRLQIQDNDKAVADSGEIHVPRYFAQTLPTGSYTARLGTKIDGTWQWTTSPITVTSNGPNTTSEIKAAHWATDYVRHMADGNNYAFAWSGLSSRVNTTAFSIQALCNNYSYELTGVLGQMNVTTGQTGAHQPRVFNSYFSDMDGHTMVEFWNADDSDWIVLDPTFAIAMKRASDGHWATAADAHSATVARDWSGIQYVPLGDFGNDLANAYYVDYPLLYLNPPGQSPWVDPTPFLREVQPWPTDSPGVYTVSSNEHPVTILRDGDSYKPSFGSRDPLSAMFQARSVALPAGSTASMTVYTPNRFVFGR